MELHRMVFVKYTKMFKIRGTSCYDHGVIILNYIFRVNFRFLLYLEEEGKNTVTFGHDIASIINSFVLY